MACVYRLNSNPHPRYDLLQCQAQILYGCLFSRTDVEYKLRRSNVAQCSEGNSLAQILDVKVLIIVGLRCIDGNLTFMHC